MTGALSRSCCFRQYCQCLSLRSRSRGRTCAIRNINPKNCLCLFWRPGSCQTSAVEYGSYLPPAENNSGIRMAASAMSLIIFISFVLVKVINVSNDFLSLGFDCKVSVQSKNSCYQTLNLSFTKDKQSCQNVKNLLTTFLTR